MTQLDPWLQKLDVLRGARQIAEFMGVTLNHVYRLFCTPRIPISREGGTRVARRSALKAWYDSGGDDDG